MHAEAMKERFEMRLAESTLEQVDVWRARQNDVPSRSEAVRRLVETGLSVTGDRKQIKLSDGEKLISMMLCQLFKNLKLRGDINPEFVEAAIDGGHYWALEWKYPDIFQGREHSGALVTEVLQVLDMWRFLERGYRTLSVKDKKRVAKEAEPLGEHVSFDGFDGNGEAEYISVAHLLIEKLDRFSEFKGRDLNAHMPTIDTHKRMSSVFEPLRSTLAGRELNAPEIIEILKARLHPSRRKP